MNVVGDVAFCGASPQKRSSLLPHTLRVSSRDFPEARVSIRVPHCRKIFRSRFSFPLLYSLLIPVPPSPFSYFWLFSILFYSVFLSAFFSLSSTDGGGSRGSASSQDFVFGNSAIAVFR